jgi:hypothetical protein
MYRGPEERDDLLLPFLNAGLDAGQTCFAALNDVNPSRLRRYDAEGAPGKLILRTSDEPNQQLEGIVAAHVILRHQQVDGLPDHLSRAQLFNDVLDGISHDKTPGFHGRLGSRCRGPGPDHQSGTGIRCLTSRKRDQSSIRTASTSNGSSRSGSRQ